MCSPKQTARFEVKYSMTANCKVYGHDLIFWFTMYWLDFSFEVMSSSL